MDIERNNRLYARLRIALPIMMAIVYPYFCVAATVFLPGPVYRPIPVHWVGIDYLTIPMLLTPLIWFLFGAWSLYFEPGGRINSILVLVITASTFAFIILFFFPFLLTDYLYIDRKYSSLSARKDFVHLFLFLFLYLGFCLCWYLRQPHNLLLWLTSIQFIFMLYSFLKIEMGFALILFLPFFLSDPFGSDQIPMFVFQFIYVLQVLASLLLLFVLASSLVMTPLAIRLKRLGYRNVPLNALWLLFKKSRTSDLKLVPASQVDHDLMECVRINYAPPTYSLR